MASLALSWQQKGDKKRLAVLDLIPLAWRIENPPSRESQKNVTGAYVQQFLNAKEIDITESDAVKIVEKTRSGKWSATEVVTAFCHRAAIAHQLTNCLHEIFFDQAIADAKALDEKFATNGPVGPLHGLPMSFKDQFHVRGVETTMGYVGWIGTFEGIIGSGKEKIVESELVREMRALGAIPFCKTSLPHTVMSILTWNNIAGTAYNPNNRLMSTGGSSGGEGALIAMRGSPLGIGTDIGGSIRIPAAFNGLYGIRPSFGRLPYVGAANSMPGQNTIPSVCGPLATTARSLRLMIESTLRQEPWLYDPAVVDMPWREPQALPKDGSKLTFGLYFTDGSVNPQPPVQRALETMKTLIQSMGHDVVEWNPPSHARALQLAIEVITADGGIDIHHHIGLSGETLQPEVAQMYGERPTTPKTADWIHKSNIEVRAYQKEYMNYWNSSAQMTKSGKPVDAIIAPVAPYAALQLESAMGEGYKSSEDSPHKGLALKGIAYVPWVNLLDYTAVVIPVSKVDPKVDKFQVDYQPLNDVDKSIWEQYDPPTQEGTPIGVQLVGRRFQEEKMLALAEMFENALAASSASRI